DPQHFDWQTVDMTHREYENEIARQEFVNDELATKQFAHLKSRQEKFEASFANLRSHFDNSFASGDQRPGNFHEFVAMCHAKNAAFWARAKVAYQQWGAALPDVETLQLFTKACPP